MEDDNFLNNDEKTILIHFSSVGEFNLSKELIERILENTKIGKKQKIILKDT